MCVRACVCVCGGRGCVRFVSFILHPQLNPHQTADSGSMRCSGELANCMKDLTLFAHTAPQDTAFQILQQALQVQVHYHMKKRLLSEEYAVPVLLFPMCPHLVVGIMISME